MNHDDFSHGAPDAPTQDERTEDMLSMSMFASRADYDAAVRAQADDEQRAHVVTGSPDTIWLCYGELLHDDTHVECHDSGTVMWCEDRQEPSDVRYVRADLLDAEHAQRVTLQHNAADQAQRIADLETKCDTLKRLHDAAADERDALRVKVSDLDRAAVKRREISDGVEAELVDECDTLRMLKSRAESERDELASGMQSLRARMAEIEAQEPLFYYRPIKGGSMYEGPHWAKSIGGQMLREESPGEWKPLYAHPVPAQTVPDGWRLVPERLTQAMQDVVDGDDWQWADLLAAAESITEGQFNALTASPEAAK